MRTIIDILRYPVASHVSYPDRIAWDQAALIHNAINALDTIDMVSLTNILTNLPCTKDHHREKLDYGQAEEVAEELVALFEWLEPKFNTDPTIADFPEMKNIVQLTDEWYEWNASNKVLRFGQHIMNKYYEGKCPCPFLYHQTNPDKSYNQIYEIICGNSVKES